MLAWALLGAAGAGLLVVGLSDPHRGDPWLPRCAFHALTGMHCPGCGGTRALHHLLHGEPLAALRHNALALVALPPLAWVLGDRFLRANGWRGLPLARLRPWMGWAIAGAFIGFFVLRNVPLWPCTLLAPPG